MNKLAHEEQMDEAKDVMGSSRQTRDRDQRGHRGARSATQGAARPVAQRDDRPGAQETARGNLPRGGAPTESPSTHRSAAHGTMEKSSTGRGNSTAAGTSHLKQQIEKIAARYHEFLHAKPATGVAATSPTVAKADLGALAATTAQPGTKSGAGNAAKRGMPGLSPRAAVFTPGAGTRFTEAEEDASLPPPVVEDDQPTKSAAGAGAWAAAFLGPVERGRDACTCSGLKKAKGLAGSRFARPATAPVAGQSRLTGVCPVHDAWEAI